MWKRRKKPTASIVPAGTVEELQSQKAIIMEHKDSFIKVGMALNQIKAMNLWMLDKDADGNRYKGWQDWCRQFDFSRQWADTLIDAADGYMLTAQQPNTVTKRQPSCRFVTKPLGLKALASIGRHAKRHNAKDLLKKLPPEADEKAIQRAEAELQQERKLARREHVKANLPYAVRDAIVAGNDVRRLVREIRFNAGRLRDYADKPFGCLVPAGQPSDKIKELADQFAASAPYSDCVYCETRDKECKACKGRGWLTRSAFDAAPKELRAKSIALADKTLAPAIEGSE